MDPAMVQAMQYQDIFTGEEAKNTLNMGGLYKRQMDEKVIDYVLVEDIDKVLAKVEKLGGKIAIPKREIPSVGKIAVIQDTEENALGLWESAM